MDREEEKMQLLGFFGVYKESYKLIFSWKKIFSQITLTLILPLSFIFLIHIQVSNTLFGKIAHDTEDLTETPRDTPQHQKLLDLISSDWSTFFLFKLVYFILLLIFSLLSTSAVVYTVASFYTAKEVSFNKVMSVVPRVWKRLMVTFLCTVAAFIVYNVVAGAVTLMLALTIGVRNVGAAILLVIAIFYLVGLVYLTVVWLLASVVTVLEDSYGYEAMMKSKELIKGNMGLSVMIVLKLNVSFFLIQFLFTMVVVNGGELFSLGSMDRTIYGIVCFLLLSHLFLLMLVIQTVLYFVCKSYHREIVDKSALSDHLEVYECYEPLKTKDVNLDYHV
ncbi:uncharacterized protein LOC109789856 [Cajanus cajan]|uniref:Uncharacterized protein n=1 Tax=Cajanus cajan TaxID=3821 RepID=A0A151R5Q3_CAJCA|nr:uncharacterized protein LOC109789856 [Cajanus cajan]KYP37816.1 hypothetical protein KK1_040979 [Cajanus cajan]